MSIILSCESLHELSIYKGMMLEKWFPIEELEVYPNRELLKESDLLSAKLWTKAIAWMTMLYWMQIFNPN